MGTDQDWEKWGAAEPYFGVLTQEKFKSASLDQVTKAEFFQSGNAHVEETIARCRRLAGESFNPASALDFGCGVGRTTLPLARICDKVVGIDVSPSMLREAQRNVELAGLQNVDLRLSDDTLSRVPERFDLVHSHIVLQHIPVARGMRILAELVDRVGPDGMGSIQLTYTKSYQILDAEIQENLLLRILRKTKRVFRKLVNFVQASHAPVMEMNHYNLSRVFYLMQTRGVNIINVEFTNHGGELGVRLIFHKS